jgi:hypothetical protein
MIEVLKQMYQLLLTEPHAPAVCDQLEPMLREAIAELESQEPDLKNNALIERLEKTCLGLDTVDPLRLLVGDVVLALKKSPQRTEQNFCSRCGKRTADLTTIHTCTPPQPAKPIPCANHCEAKAFEIVIKNLRGEIERLKASQRTWVGSGDLEDSNAYQTTQKRTWVGLSMEQF